MTAARLFFILIASNLCCHFSLAQLQDRILVIKGAPAKSQLTDTSGKPIHNPHKAFMRSLILPGWGQAYNRRYWKIPVVYAALGITGYVFKSNLGQYKKARYAYTYLITRGTADSGQYQLSNITDGGLRRAAQDNNMYALQQYRNESRKYADYSALYFILFWALNVADATVDGHLKDFDVSNDLSMKIKPSFNALPNTLGMSLVFTIGKHPPKRTAWQMP